MGIFPRVIPVRFSHSALFLGDFVLLLFCLHRDLSRLFLMRFLFYGVSSSIVSFLLSAGSWGFFVYITSPQVLSPKSSLFWGALSPPRFSSKESLSPSGSLPWATICDSQEMVCKVARRLALLRGRHPCYFSGSQQGLCPPSPPPPF